MSSEIPYFTLRTSSARDANSKPRNHNKRMARHKREIDARSSVATDLYSGDEKPTTYVHTYLLKLELSMVLDAELYDEPGAFPLRRPVGLGLPGIGRVVVHLTERSQRLAVVRKLHEAVALAGVQLRGVL